MDDHEALSKASHEQWLTAIGDERKAYGWPDKETMVLSVLTHVVQRLQVNLARDTRARKTNESDTSFDANPLAKQIQGILGVTDPALIENWTYWVANDGSRRRDHADPGPAPWVKLVDEPRTFPEVEQDKDPYSRILELEAELSQAKGVWDAAREHCKEYPNPPGDEVWDLWSAIEDKPHKGPRYIQEALKKPGPVKRFLTSLMDDACCCGVDSEGCCESCGGLSRVPVLEAENASVNDAAKELEENLSEAYRTIAKVRAVAEGSSHHGMAGPSQMPPEVGALADAITDVLDGDPPPDTAVALKGWNYQCMKCRNAVPENVPCPFCSMAELKAEREEARRIANSLRPAGDDCFPWETWGKPYPYGDPPCESCATVAENRTLYPPSTTTPAAWLCWECAR
jgi:hypothetical protein